MDFQKVDLSRLVIVIYNAYAFQSETVILNSIISIIYSETLYTNVNHV